MGVEAGEDAVANAGVRVGDGGYEELAEDVGHRGGHQPHAAAPQRPLLQLGRFLEGALEQLAARPHRVQPHGALLAAQEMIGAVADELEQQRLTCVHQSVNESHCGCWMAHVSFEMSCMRR